MSNNMNDDMNRQLYPNSLGLNEGGNQEEKIVDSLSSEENSDLSDIIQQVNHIPAASYNMANDTKWIFHIPYGFLFMNKTNNNQPLEIPINCQSINFPDFKLGTTTAGFLGYTMDFSTRQNLTEKGLTINFLVNSNWLQYLALLKWFELEDYTAYNSEAVETQTKYEKYGVTVNDETSPAFTGKDPYWSTQGPMVPTNLYLMDNFNNRIATILFQNTWLCNIKSINLDYKKTSDTEISTTAEFKFSKYSVSLNNDYLNKIFQDGISKETF